jgi:hypothetical protein
MNVSIQVNVAETLRAFERMQAFAPQAIVRALNRSIASAKTAMVREVAVDTGLKSGDVRERIWVREARADQLVAELHASAKPIPLIDYGATGPEPSRGKGRGVTARLRGGAGRYPHAFLARMQSGHRGVFTRLPGNTRRLPIYELHGPSIARVFTKHVAVGQARGEEQLVKNLQSEFRFAMSKSA